MRASEEQENTLHTLLCPHEPGNYSGVMSIKLINSSEIFLSPIFNFLGMTNQEYLVEKKKSFARKITINLFFRV